MTTDTAGSGTEESKLPVGFEAWVELSARLLKLGQDDRIDVLDERRIDVDDWMRCERHYCIALADEVAAGRMERATVYGRACAAELERRRRGPAQSLEAPPGSPGDSPPKREAVAPVIAPVIEVATFQKETSAPAPATASLPVSPAATLDVADLPSFLKQLDGNLPFAGSISPAFSAPSAAPTTPAPGAGETMGVGVDLMAQVRATLPFATRTPGPAFPRLPLQSYASLCAELTVYPERTAEILGKYGIKDDEARLALDTDWRARLANHADTRQTWQGLRAQYEGWLRQQAK